MCICFVGFFLPLVHTSMAPSKAAVPWSQFKPPTTAEQRIAFLDACQRQFEVVSAIGPVSSVLVCGPASTLGGCPSMFTALDDVPNPVAHPLCVLCGKRAHAAIVANPFSDWNAILCPACMPH